MPAGVVVVKRARRRSFALMWAALAWARSVASSLRGSTVITPAPLPDEVDLVRFPAIVVARGDGTRCTACGDCVTLCPTRCLEVAGTDEQPTRFLLDPGACLGCGRCVEGCPEAALASVAAPPVLATGPSGVPPIDLLAPLGAAPGKAPAS